MIANLADAKTVIEEQAARIKLLDEELGIIYEEYEELFSRIAVALKTPDTKNESMITKDAVEVINKFWETHDDNGNVKGEEDE